MARSHVRLASTAVSIQIVEDAAGSGSRTAWMTAALAVAAAVTGVSSMTMKGKSTLCEEESAVTPSLAPRDTAPFQRFVSKGGIRDPMTTYQQYAIRREKELLQSTIGSSKDSVTTSPNSDSAATLQATSSTSETASSFKNNVSSVTMQAASSVAETVSFDEKIDGKSQVLGTQAVTTVDEASTDQPILDAATTLDGSAATTLDASAATLEDMSDAELRFEESTRKAKQHSGGLKIFSGNGNMSLALEIARHLGVNLGKATVGKFPDGEVNVVIHENVRGKDVYVVQPTGPPVNDNIMELLLMVSTLRRSSARRITVVIPYYGYARQDRKMQVRVSLASCTSRFKVLFFTHIHSVMVYFSGSRSY